MQWAPLTKFHSSRHAAALANVVRQLLIPNVAASLYPWLPFPQNMCSFKFGDPPRPLPVGALVILWDEGMPFAQPCPDCGENALRMIAFGGLLTVGGGRLICAACAGDFFQQIGGLTTVSKVLAATRLHGSEFAPSGMVFGGSVGSDGAELLDALGLPRLPIEL